MKGAWPDSRHKKIFQHLISHGELLRYYYFFLFLFFLLQWCQQWYWWALGDQSALVKETALCRHGKVYQHVCVWEQNEKGSLPHGSGSMWRRSSSGESIQCCSGHDVITLECLTDSKVFIDSFKWMGNIDLRRTSKKKPSSLHQPLVGEETEWLAHYKNTRLASQSRKRICQRSAGGFVIRGHWCPWPDDMWQSDSGRYIPSRP